MKKLRLSLLLFFFNYILFAQTPSEKISADYSNISLEEVIRDLQKKSSRPFFYKSEWMINKTVNSKLNNETVFNAVRTILKGQNLTFVVYEPYIVLLQGNVEEDYPESIKEEAEDLILPVFSAPTRRSITLDRQSNAANKGKVTGRLTDQSTGEPVVGATVVIEELKAGELTDINGFYSISVPAAKYTISFSSVGSKTIKRSIDLNTPKVMNIEMEPELVQISEVTVYGEAEDHNIVKAEMSRTKLDIKTIKKMPPFMGEVDVLKSILLLPGVTTVGEGSSGFNVRGGSTDQNLILYDDAPLYNPNHMFGLFSVFNPDMVKEVTLYRGGIPAQYGGRVSSVLDIKSKDLTAKKLTGKGGIGIVASRFSLEGPIIKDRLKFMLGTRGSFADPFLKLSKNNSIKSTRAYFYDVNAKVEWTAGKRDKIFISAYQGKDAFRFAEDSVGSLDQNATANKFSWGNTNATIRWGHIFNSKLIANLSGVYSNYETLMENTKDPSKFKMTSDLDYKSLKLDLSYTPSYSHRLTGGVSSIYYKITPPEIIPGENSNINPSKIESEYGLESALYLNDEFVLNSIITISAGLRYSSFQYLGPKSVYLYNEGQTKTLKGIYDTISFSRNEKIAGYGGLEPRLSIKVSVSEDASFKAGYTKLRQYIGLVSNTTSAVPTDRWKLSDSNILPQISDQYSIGFFKNFSDNSIETSIETYYKNIDNLLDYKNGANLITSPALETELISAKGRAYGAELMVRKTKGVLMGWISYTYSRTEIQTDGLYKQEKVNNGKYYPANYDKPHFLNMVLNYQRNKRWNLAANFTYSTGRPFSYPDGKYIVNGVQVANYPERNNARIPDYHRLDLSATVEPNHKKNKKWEGSWTFSIYNVYNRRNAYSVFFLKRQAYKLTILGTTFPSITYNFKF